MSGRFHIRIRKATALAATACLLASCPALGQRLTGAGGSPGGKAQALGLPTVPPDQLHIASVEPTIVGVGTKIRIRGSELGTADSAAVQFAGGVVTTWVEEHRADEVIVRVPIGAKSGPLRVVVGAGSAEQLAAMDEKGRVAALAAARTAIAPQELIVVCSHVDPYPANQIVDTGDGLRVLKHRLIVDLQDFRGVHDAARIAERINGKLAGFFAPSNSYVIDLKEPPADYGGLQAVMNRVQADPIVVEASPDMVLDLKQVIFADTDNVDRYRQMRNPPDANINGREDMWYMDRAQGPAAWNLMARFVPAPAAVKVAVLDSGCDQTHAEFAGVTLTQIKYSNTQAIRLTLTGEPAVFPVGIVEEPYTRGDANGHGTAVCSIIGAANGAVIPGAPNGDRGINGMLAGGGGTYTLQIHRGGLFPGEPHEPGDTYTLTHFLEAINGAALTTPTGRVTVINASWGQPRPIDPATNPAGRIVRVSLRKLARQLTVFRDQVLLCVAAGNEGRDPLSYNGGEVTPFEDFNLNGVLDAGEDVDGDGTLDHGNYVGASLGTLPNVITVGAIVGSQLAGAGPYTRDDERYDTPGNPFRSSNWGTRAAGTNDDVVVGLAAPGGRDIFTATIAGVGFQIGSQWYNPDFGGTSAATPMVTGSAGLLLAIEPALTPAQVKSLLTDNSFPITTTTSGGAALDWDTLKVGAAVRKLLMDEGIIADDDPWTGTSKLLDFETDPDLSFVTLLAHEVRQNAVTRRSEVFRVTPLGVLPLGPPGPPPLGPPTLAPALSWSGRKVAIDTGDITELDLATGLTRLVLAGPAWGDHLLHYVGEDHVFSGRWIWDPACVAPWDGYQTYDESALHAVGAGPPPGSKYGWFAFYAPKPNNKLIYHSYFIEWHHLLGAPPCASIGETLGTFGTTTPYPAPAVVTLGVPPVPAVTPWFSPMWSPDGRIFSGGDGPALHARRFGPDGAAVWSVAGPDRHVWSPDGSEILVLGVGAYKRNHTEPVALVAPYPVWSW
jgi:hypothetical protein